MLVNYYLMTFHFVVICCRGKPRSWMYTLPATYSQARVMQLKWFVQEVASWTFSLILPNAGSLMLSFAFNWKRVLTLLDEYTF